MEERERLEREYNETLEALLKLEDAPANTETQALILKLEERALELQTEISRFGYPRQIPYRNNPTDQRQDE